MTNTSNLVTLVTILNCCHPRWAPAEQIVADSSAVLETLDKTHPRLMWKDGNIVKTAGLKPLKEW